MIMTIIIMITISEKGNIFRIIIIIIFEVVVIMIENDLNYL